jgi:hypothetical protein
LLRFNRVGELGQSRGAGNYKFTRQFKHGIPNDELERPDGRKWVEDFGLRWQSTATTPLFDRGHSFQSGAALCFPPQLKSVWLRFLAVIKLVNQYPHGSLLCRFGHAL